MSTLRLITTPYSFNKSLFEAYSDIFSLVNDDDWVCFIDGDVAFLEMSDFGHIIQGYIDRYPETGLFTCYASRCHYECQKTDFDMSTDSIKEVAKKTVAMRSKLWEYSTIERRIAGHLIVMQKSTWNKIFPILEINVLKKRKKILGFDTLLSNAVCYHGFDIKLMKGLFVFHYLRMLNGTNDKIE
jgi:hypothetical protein